MDSLCCQSCLNVEFWLQVVLRLTQTPNHEHKNVRRLHAVWFCLSFVRSLIDGIWRLRHIFVGVVVTVVVVVVVVGLLFFFTRTALCSVFWCSCWFSWLSAPFKNVVIWTPTETSSCRRCQSDSGRDSLTFWAAASLWLGTYTHVHTRRHTRTGEEGIRPLPPSPPVLRPASSHPSCPPVPLLLLLVHSQRSRTKLCPTCQLEELREKRKFCLKFKAVFRGFLRSQHAWAVS